MSDTSTGETAAQDPTPTEPSATTENGPTEPATLPDDHPLVRAFAAQKERIASLSEKAKKLDEIEEANKTAEQKQAELIASLEAKVSDYETREQVSRWKSEISQATGVPADVLEGSTREAIEAHAAKLKPLIAASTPQRIVIPNEGGNGSSTPLNSSELEEKLRRAVGAS